MSAPVRFDTSVAKLMPLLPQIHPVLASLPPVDSLTLEAVTQDMRSNGQHLPIVLYEGMLWDGRARLDVDKNFLLSSFVAKAL